ncbi:MAG TPA: PP2C family protein-serine/threonine phosphatase [Vicinamibacterales bacterium]|nr:PP2C family protein-serine/threonine phosphatase [Vicinamibacterales bacterium]
MLVGDVSGKGVPAALVLTSIRTMFRMMTSETSDPGELVERIAKRLYEDHGGTPYLTCLVVRIDLERREFADVNAGHPAGIVLGGRTPGMSPLLLAPCGPPAGLFPSPAYRTAFLPIPNGAVSILVTDGITEAFDVLSVPGWSPAAARPRGCVRADRWRISKDLSQMRARTAVVAAVAVVLSAAPATQSVETFKAPTFGQVIV